MNGYPYDFVNEFLLIVIVDIKGAYAFQVLKMLLNFDLISWL